MTNSKESAAASAVATNPLMDDYEIRQYVLDRYDAGFPIDTITEQVSKNQKIGTRKAKNLVMQIVFEDKIDEKWRNAQKAR